MSRLLQSFAADDGFRLDEESSFSEGEEEEDEEEEAKQLLVHLPPNMPSRIPGTHNLLLHSHTATDKHTNTNYVLIHASSLPSLRSPTELCVK